MTDVAAAIARAAADLRHARREALDLAVGQDFLLAPAHRAWAIESTLGRFEIAALRGLVSSRFEGARVRVILAATVPLAPLRALALPLLAGAVSVSARPSRKQSAVTTVVIEALRAQGLPVRLSHTRWHEGEGAVVAYGADESLAAIAAALPPEVAFEGHGHGFGAVLVDLSQVDAGTAAEALAHDVAAYDQRGCLSPQVVFTVGGAVARFADRLAEALAAREGLWPRAPLDPGTGAAVAQWQGVQAALAEGMIRAARYSVAWWTQTRMQSSPGARNLALVAAPSLEAVRATLDPWAAFASSVGLAGITDEAWRPVGFAGRVCVLGAMQDPALDGPEDPRPVRRR